jgi:predicted nuclease of restriction endonuclease-like (RecB) superfamily
VPKWPTMHPLPLPWGHIRELLDKLDTADLREWYGSQAVENGWSRNVPLNQIMSQLHRRLGAAPSNLG